LHSEAHKRDGDVKLASLSDQGAVVLELTRTEAPVLKSIKLNRGGRRFSGFSPNAMRHNSA